MQLLRSAISSGANVEEAQASPSRFWAIEDHSLLNEKPFLFNKVWAYLTIDEYGEGTQSSLAKLSIFN
jgi:hypothetical protein